VIYWGILVASIMITSCMLFEKIYEYIILKRANVHPLNEIKKKLKK
jgi:hypothetical protein